MARARSLLWIGVTAAIIYLFWRWRSQQAGEPGLIPSPTLPNTPSPDVGPRAPEPPESPAPPAPPEPPAAAAVAVRERAVGAAEPIEVEPSASESQEQEALAEAEPPAPDSQEAPAQAEPSAVDLASLVGPAAETQGVDLAPLVGPTAALKDAGLSGPVNINTADLEALIALPGIGPALARRIIAYREQHGPFTSVDQLIDVQGIGPRNITDFRHLVTV